MSQNPGIYSPMGQTYSNQLGSVNFTGYAYVYSSSTISVQPTTSGGKTNYINVTSNPIPIAITVGNHIVGPNIPVGTIITQDLGSGIYKVSKPQTQGGSSVNAYVCIGTPVQYGQVVASAPTYGSSIYGGQLDFYVPAPGKTFSTMTLVNGNVGIGGRTAPLQALDVSGSVLISGNVGIGTTNPLYALDVNNVIAIKSTNNVNYNQTSTLGFGFGGGGGIGTPFRWKIDDITLNRDSGAGPNYDYGAQSKLIFSCKSNNSYGSTINDQTYIQGLTLVPNSLGNSGLSTGINVGIGTTNPTTALDVNGSSGVILTVRNNSAVYNSSTSAIQFECATSNNTMGQIACIDRSVGPNGAFTNDMVFYCGYNTSLSERLRITGNGGNGIIMLNSVANGSTVKTQLSVNYSTTGPTVSVTAMRIYWRDNAGAYRYADFAGTTFFTGQHMVVPDNPELKTNLTEYVGLIVSSNDTGYTSYYNGIKYTGIDAIRICESLPNCKLANTDNDKAVFGVITNQQNDSYFDTDGNPVYDNTDDGFERSLYDRVRVNSVGEGSIWVTNINGNIENGDYITSSLIPGYGKRQNDDLLHNYTVGKATMSCDFSTTSNKYRTKTVEFNGQTYIAAFIGCTYHCG